MTTIQHHPAVMRPRKQSRRSGDRGPFSRSPWPLNSSSSWTSPSSTPPCPPSAARCGSTAPTPMARHGLPAHVRGRPAARGPDGRPAPPSPRLPDRADGVHPRVAGERLRRRRQRAHRRTRSPGPRRCADDPGRTVDRDDHVLGCSAATAGSRSGAPSAASPWPAGYCSAERSPHGPAGSSSSGSTCPSASPPCSSASGCCRGRRRVAPPSATSTCPVPWPSSAVSGR